MEKLSDDKSGTFAKKQQDESFLLKLNRHLETLELEPLSTGGSEIPAVYIVGAPRSGTTLLYQLLCKFLPVGYINNLAARFWLKPAVGIRLAAIMMGEDARKEIEFASNRGITTGPAGPHEFGYFWTHLMGLENNKSHHLNDIDQGVIDIKQVKDILENEILATFGKPVVFKNLTCGFQAPLLSAAHEKSAFIHIERDLRSTCASILKSRMDIYGDYASWFSLKPSTYESFPDDPIKQVVMQVCDSRKEIRERVHQSNAASLSVDYATLCKEPGLVLQQTSELIESLGWPISPLGAPPGFTQNGAHGLPVDLMQKLDDEIERFQQQE